METERTAGSCPAVGQTAVRTWLPSRMRGATASRFHGDGVRYKAKLIGVDPVPDSQGEKMCWDSMMKLKGFEAAGRKQGKHKQRIWLKISSNGLKIVDERTGAVLYDHEKSKISSLTKDESDPRALAYIYQHQDTYSLFFIKMANLADPVLADIKEVCQRGDKERPQEPAEGQTQTISLLLLNVNSAHPSERPALEDVFSPRPGSSSNQVSSSAELVEVFSMKLEEQLSSTQSSWASQPESPQSNHSTSQIFSMFPVQPVGGAPYSCSPYSCPPYSPTAMPWGQQGPLGSQWAGPAVPLWPTMPSGMAAQEPAGTTMPLAGVQIQAHGPQPGVIWRGATPSSSTTSNGYPSPFNSIYAPAGATAALQSVSPGLNHNPQL